MNLGREDQKGRFRRIQNIEYLKELCRSNYKTNSYLPNFRKKSRREEAVTPTTSSYNLRPRSRKRAESRPTIERKTQQGGPVRSEKADEGERQPLHRRANKIKQQECQTRR
ncbi:hypothetical protein TNCV_3643491 [Trichonephila clavipes]|nr:hypothetical protein TNCV_3643491 [Trichonephila clavipes]